VLSPGSLGDAFIDLKPLPLSTFDTGSLQLRWTDRRTLIGRQSG